MNFKFPLTDEEATLPLSDAKEKLEELAPKHLGGQIRYEVLVEKSDDKPSPFWKQRAEFMPVA